MIKLKIVDSGTELKPTHLTKYKIDVQGHEPIKQRYYHVSPKIHEFMYQEVGKLLSEE